VAEHDLFVLEDRQRTGTEDRGYDFAHSTSRVLLRSRLCYAGPPMEIAVRFTSPLSLLRCLP
jgi:hypothetical protein